MKNPRSFWLSFRAARHLRNRRLTLLALVLFGLLGSVVIKQFQWQSQWEQLLAASAQLFSLGKASAKPVALVTAPGPIQSSPLALTPDEQRLLNVNPDADTVTVFNVAGATPVKLAEIAVGGEPSSVAIHPNGQTAYVANALDGTVSVITLNPLNCTTTAFAVGVEPMALALSPNGTRLYVASASSNVLQVFETASLPPARPAHAGPAAPQDFVNLGSYGTSPRTIAVTNDGDGDDTDETIFVALFFGQLRPGKGSVQEGQDDQREGRVVAISAANNMVLGPVALGPITDTGFNSNGKLAPATAGPEPSVFSTNPQTFNTPTGAFPNQLASVAIHPTNGKSYVVSTGASPNGPFRFNSNTQGLVSVFNNSTRTEVTSGQTGANFRQTAPLNLNQGINHLPPGNRFFMSNPVAMAWRPNGSDAWVAVQNSDLIVRLTVDGNGIPTAGNPLAAGGMNSQVRVDLTNPGGGLIPGKAPRGIAMKNDGTKAYVSNFISRSVSVVNISNPTNPMIEATANSTALPTPGTMEATAQLGAELFHTGRGPQERMSSESWGGCIVCHPNGRSDNVTWMFEAGPRQTIPLDGMFNKTNPADQRILNWSAVRDENHDFEKNTRDVFGGRGLIDDDRLFYAIGGANGPTPNESSLIEQLQNFTGAVTTTNDLANGAPLPQLLGQRRDFSVATLDDNRVFIVGGRSGAGQGSLVSAMDAVLEFNPRTNTLVRRNSSGFTRRHSLGAAAVKTSSGPRIYAVGGYTSTSATTIPTSTVEEYNPATDTWRTVASLPNAVAQFGIAVSGGVNTAEAKELIQVVSGNSDFESTGFAQNKVQSFVADPNGTGTWTVVNVTGLTPRRNHGAATALRGVQTRVFVIGGQNNAGTVLNTVEEYNPSTLSAVLSQHTNMPDARAKFAIASTLSSNQIYVFGGMDGTGADRTEVFEYTINANPESPGLPGLTGTPSGTWATRGNLSSPKRSLSVSIPPGVTNFLPAKSKGRDERQDAIAVWIANKVRAAKPPVSPTDSMAVAGRSLFGQTGLVVAGFSCANCHGGAKWTRSTVDFTGAPSPDIGLGLGNEQVIGAELRRTNTQPNTQSAVTPPQFPGVLLNVGTFTLGGGRVNEIRFNGADISQAINPLGNNGINIPSLLSVHETAPYFYSGLAQTLEQVLNGSQDNNGGVRHHFVNNTTQRAQLIAFLRSIDQTTPSFPRPNEPDPSVVLAAKAARRNTLRAAPTGGCIVCDPITITPPTLPAGTVGVGYNQPLTANGGTAPHTFVLDGGALPAGISLSQTGVLSGIPMAAGTANFTVKATDQNGCIGMQAYTLVVNCPAITITPGTLPNGVAGVGYNQPLTANGGVGPHNFMLNGGALPNGITLSPSGVLAGTPTATGTFNFGVKATDQNGCMGTQNYTLTINCDVITVNPATVPAGRINQAYPATLFTATGGFGPHTFNLNGTLPTGMNFANAMLGGTPTQTGSFPLTVTATDAANCTGTRNYVLLVSGRGVKADFDGDGMTDLSVWRGPTTNWLVINSANQQLQTVSWGSSNAPFFDLPVPGDYDGDGKIDHAVWRGNVATWFIRRSSDGQTQQVLWGSSNAPFFDLPVPGDYDGDGKTDIAVWRPPNGTWFIIRSSDGSIIIEQWGVQTDIPVQADYDGDGKTDIAVWRGNDTNWYIKRSTGGVEIISWGSSAAPFFDTPVPGDYDGDGKADVAVWRGNSTNWFIKRSTGGVDITSWGTSNAPFFDIPVPGDYDGDGKIDIAVWRPPNGTWFVRRSSNGTILTQQHGQNGDTPIPNR